MRIKICTDGHNFSLWLPTRLFINPLSAIICVKIARKIAHVDLPCDDLRKLFVIVRKSRDLLNGEPMVSLCSAEGEYVDIWI